MLLNEYRVCHNMDYRTGQQVSRSLKDNTECKAGCRLYDNTKRDNCIGIGDTFISEISSEVPKSEEQGLYYNCP